MFRNAIRLPVRLLGIPLYLDWSFLLVLPLIAWLIASRVGLHAELFGMQESTERLTAGATPLVLGSIAAIGLFLSVVLHELGHAVTARLYGVEVKSITLWFLGGVAAMKEMPRHPGGEAVVGIAGPLVSFALGGVCWLGVLAVGNASIEAAFVLRYLALINVVLAVFNLIPALPLDGGRILRSLLALRMPHLEATRVAAGIGKGLAVVMGIFGLLTVNVFLIFIAFFVFMMAHAEQSQSVVVDLLGGLRVRDLMTRELETVPETISVGELAREMFQRRRSGFPVEDAQGRIVGVVGVAQLKGAEQSTPVARVMRSPAPAISPEAEAIEALRMMSEDDYQRLIVTDEGGAALGIVCKSDLLRAIEVRSVGLGWRPRRQVA